MVVSSLRWSGDTAFFSYFPLTGSVIEIFHPLSLETCNGSIIAKAQCSFMQFKISADEHFLPRKSSASALKNAMKATVLKLRQSNAMTEQLQ